MLRFDGDIIGKRMALSLRADTHRSSRTVDRRGSEQ